MIRRKSARLAAFAVAGLFTGSSALGACPDDAAVAAMAADILAATPTDPVAVETIEDGLCAQEKLVKILEKEWGEPIGYKAGLTSEPAQKTFGVTSPVRGVLLANMMFENDVVLSATFGALPRYEADMIVVVADDGINGAKTPKDVLAHLSAIHPFIELPDLVVKNPKTLTGPVITAINVGARQGVLGKGIVPEQTDDFLNALARMTVTVTDETGAEFAKAPGAAVLGHPLNAVLWLRDSGITFKPGDMVSLGSFGPLLPPKSGQTATVTYEGMPGNPSVRVSFE